MAICHALDKRGAAARARPGIGGGGGAVDLVGVVAVDDDALEPVGGGAIGGGMLDRRHFSDRRIFHIQIVLADEDHRQLPHRREIQRLMEGADIGRAVAEEAHCHVAVALVLRA